MTEMTAEQFAKDDREVPAELAAAWREDARRRSERPEEFWNGQQLRIRGRIENQSARKPLSLRLAVATAMLIFFAILLIAPAGPRPQQARPHAEIDADQQLLLAVEHALAVGTPEALEPLTLLVESTSNHDVET
ncbi:MAG TPA: hypothetical protein VF953_11215, partial [Terriglobales bacterium]